MANQKTPKFKVGDVIVCLKNYPITKIGSIGTVVEHPENLKHRTDWVFATYEEHIHIKDPLAIHEREAVKASKLHKILK